MSRGRLVAFPARWRTHRQPSRRVMYVQYTNPAAYPPLEHSSRIAAGQGWDVLFVGAEVLGAAALRFTAGAMCYSSSRSSAFKRTD